jgi:preprotein translocase subunit YajC
VITTGGLYGTVTEIEDGDTVLLEVAEDTEIRISKAAIVRVITGTDVPEHEDAAPESDETDADTDNG